MTSNLIESNIPIRPPPAMPYRATRWPGKPAIFRRNLIWASGQQPAVGLGRGGGRFTSWDKWLAAGLGSGSVLADPLLRDPPSARLGSRSPAFKLGFRPIPTDKIGCYKGPDRATRPLRNDCLTAHEKPLLAARNPRPLQESFREDLPAYPRAPILPSAARAASGRPSAAPEKSASILSRGHKLASIPLGQWFQISLTIPLGPKSAGASEAVLSIPGRQPIRLRLPYLHRDFRRLDRLVIFCPADRSGTAFIDDLTCR